VADQHNPTVLYNGMIAPFVPYAIRGILWYQGESITGRHELFPMWNETLIRDWRKLWGSELPFYFCQLSAQDASSNSPEVRELQAAALALPATAMAVTVDIGDRHNVHPKDKQDVGDRLTRIALSRVYGRQIESSGPEYQSMTIEGGALRLGFTHLGGGLVARGGPLQTFVVAGAEDRRRHDRRPSPGCARADRRPLCLGQLPRRLQSLQRRRPACGAISHRPAGALTAASKAALPRPLPARSAGT